MVATDWTMNSCLSKELLPLHGTLEDLWTLSPHERSDIVKEIPLDYSYAGHWTSRKNNSNTPRLYLLPCFSARKHTPDAFCAPVCTPWHHHHKKHHLVVGHILMCTLSKFEVNQTNSSWDIDIFVSSPLFFLFWSLSAPDHSAPETWPQNHHQCHSNSSPSLSRPLQMLLPVCWQLGQPP